MITLKVNGDTQSVTSGLNVRAFLAQLNLAEQLVVLEYNGDILHRQYWNETILQDQDQLEIVTVVGGG